jgi:hypothetical protein
MSHLLYSANERRSRGDDDVAHLQQRDTRDGTRDDTRDGARDDTRDESQGSARKKTMTDQIEETEKKTDLKATIVVSSPKSQKDKARQSASRPSSSWSKAIMQTTSLIRFQKQAVKTLIKQKATTTTTEEIKVMHTVRNRIEEVEKLRTKLENQIRMRFTEWNDTEVNSKLAHLYTQYLQV